MGSDYLFFDRYKTTDFHHGGKRRPTSKPRAPRKKETDPVNAKRVGAAVFTVSPPLCLAKR